MSRRKARFGRHLPTLPSGPFLSNMPDAMRCIVGDDYTLSPTTRPYLTKAGFLTVRLVFRTAERTGSLVVTWTLGAPVSDELAALLRGAARGVVFLVPAPAAPAAVGHG